MRKAFWIVVVAAATLFLFGFVTDSPMIPDIMVTALDSWYTGKILPMLIIGAIVGASMGVIARKTTKYRPGMRLSSVPRRIQIWGLVSIVVVIISSYIAGGIFAAASTFPLDTMQRLGTLLPTLKFTGLGVGAAVCAGAIAYAVVSSWGDWGGKYAIVPNRKRPEKANA